MASDVALTLTATIALAVSTFRWPRELERLLDALATLRTSESVIVIVAGNDTDCREGQHLYERRRETVYRLQLVICMVSERGISQVRNALVEWVLHNINAQLIAMIDDDEWPESDWLEHLIAVRRRTAADIVGGPVVPHYEVTPPPWIATNNTYLRPGVPTGPIDFIEPTGNKLFSKRCFLSSPPPWFDPAFGLSGGEDRDFFVRLKQKGAKFAWADKAIVYEWTPSQRTTTTWIPSRAYRTGNTHMRVVLKSCRMQLGREAVLIAAVMILSPLGLCLFGWSRTQRLRFLRKIWRSAGKLAALLGKTYYEYDYAPTPGRIED